MNDLNSQLKECVTYWRQCLVDAVEFEIKKDTIVGKVNTDENHFSVPKEIVETFFRAYKAQKFPKKKTSNAFEDEDDQLSSVPVLYAPVVLRHVDFQLRGTEVIPFWIRASLEKNGELIISPNTFPVFNDKCIEPCRHSFFSFEIGRAHV